LIQTIAMPDISSNIEKLTEERLMYKNEMLKAIACRTKRQKIKLAQEWKKNYSAMTYVALINLARNHEARLKVAYWDVSHFEQKRIGKHA
jgi:hypothetical protein